MKQRNAQRRNAIASVAFIVYSIGAMSYSSQQPGQTRAQAADAHQAVVMQCESAKAAGAALVARTAACIPAPLRQADAWLMFGMLVLGTVMLCTGIAANREGE